MPHNLDGYELGFTGRRSWKASRSLDGELIDTVPVTWTKDLYREGNHRFLRIWLRKDVDAEEYSRRRTSYVVAVAKGKDDSARPMSFSKFVALYEVVSTGKRLEDRCIEARIVKRVISTGEGVDTKRKFARIAYNSAGWRNPTGDARELEADGTYNREYGFGHEDWLFREEWTIAGWRYAFLQGVNKQWKKLVAAEQPIDVTLFTVEPDRRRRFVARIHDLECLSDTQADAALDEFTKRGWLDIMHDEIRQHGGDPDALGAAEWARHILNVRFRLDSVTRYPEGEFVAPSDPIMGWHRYLVYEGQADDDAEATGGRQRAGSAEPPVPRSHFRRGGGAVEVSPEHARMQKRLMDELRVEFPKPARIVREENFIDVLVETETDIFIFEIKSDLSPFRVLRLAVGQLLEYAFRQPNPKGRAVHLIAVGRVQLTGIADAYLQHLQERFFLPLDYRVVAI